MQIETVVAYIRVSTDDKDQRPERQRTFLEGYAQREGLKVAAWIIDEGTSASKVEPLNRTKVLLAIKEAKKHGATAILVENLDRWCRTGNRSMVVADVRLEADYGLRVIMADMPTGMDGLAYEIIQTVKAEMAKEYTRLMGERISQGLKLAKKDGWPKGKPGAKPKDPVTGDEMAKVAEWKMSMGWRKVAVRLNADRGVFEIADTTLRRKRSVSEAWLRSQVEQRAELGCVLARSIPKENGRAHATVVDSAQAVDA